MIHSLVESWAEVAPESLLLLDLNSRVIDGPADLNPPSERYIHSEIYRARADIGAAALGEIDPLSEQELEAPAAPSPPEFEDHYAAKIWRYYVGRGIDAGVIPAAWRQAIQ